MVQLVEVHVVCDRCREEDPDSRVEATETVPVAFGGPPFFELDLCSEHAKPCFELRDFATTRGRALKAPPMKPGRSKVVGGSTDAYREGDQWRCPECGQLVDTPQGLASHRRMAHSQTAACPQCGKLFKGSGMTNHLMKTHGLDKDQQPLPES